MSACKVSVNCLHVHGEAVVQGQFDVDVEGHLHHDIGILALFLVHFLDVLRARDRHLTEAASVQVRELGAIDLGNVHGELREIECFAGFTQNVVS